MYTSTVTTKGQVTLPVNFRKALNISPGSKVNFVFDQRKKEVVIKPLYSFKSFAVLGAFGMWKDRKMSDTNAYVKKMRQKAWSSINN